MEVETHSLSALEFRIPFFAPFPPHNVNWYLPKVKNTLVKYKYLREQFEKSAAYVMILNIIKYCIIVEFFCFVSFSKNGNIFSFETQVRYTCSMGNWCEFYEFLTGVCAFIPPSAGRSLFLPIKTN